MTYIFATITLIGLCIAILGLFLKVGFGIISYIVHYSYWKDQREGWNNTLKGVTDGSQ